MVVRLRAVGRPLRHRLASVQARRVQPRLVSAAIVLLAVCVLVAGASARANPSGNRGGPPTRHVNAAAVSFSRIVVIVFENKEESAVLGSRTAPTFNRLRRRYAVLGNYFGVAHPSLPNYLALVSGSTQGITNNCADCTVNGRSLADTLEAAGKTWKTYAEGLPSPGFTGAVAGRYAKKHNPFVYFTNVLASPERLGRVVPLTRFRDDLAARELPDFSLIVPDLCHDMHDCSVATGDAWLNRFVPPLLRSPQLRRGAVFVVFDEGPASDRRGGGGHVPALVLGPLVRPGSHSLKRLDHYGLLRTIEDAWGLPRLGRSASAATISGIWRAR